MNKGWNCYHHALLYNGAPHEEPAEEEKIIEWKKYSGFPVLARYTENFDLGRETSYWYCIKDGKYSIDSLKAKRRYEINKGRKNFTVSTIDPFEYVESIYQVNNKAFETYEKGTKIHTTIDKVKATLDRWKGDTVYGAFSRQTGQLEGYALLKDKGKYMEFNVLKVNPEEEKNAVNAAIVDQILMDCNDRLGPDFYILDGARPILHKTHFQEYLEKYFGFRKAYCRLRIIYRKPFKTIIQFTFRFKDSISEDSKIGARLLGILKLEEIARECNE